MMKNTKPSNQTTNTEQFIVIAEEKTNRTTKCLVYYLQTQRTEILSKEEFAKISEACLNASINLSTQRKKFKRSSSAIAYKPTKLNGSNVIEEHWTLIDVNHEKRTLTVLNHKNDVKEVSIEEYIDLRKSGINNEGTYSEDNAEYVFIGASKDDFHNTDKKIKISPETKENAEDIDNTNLIETSEIAEFAESNIPETPTEIPSHLIKPKPTELSDFLTPIYNPDEEETDPEFRFIRTIKPRVVDPTPEEFETQRKLDETSEIREGFIESMRKTLKIIEDSIKNGAEQIKYADITNEQKQELQEVIESMKNLEKSTKDSITKHYNYHELDYEKYDFDWQYLSEDMQENLRARIESRKQECCNYTPADILVPDGEKTYITTKPYLGTPVSLSKEQYLGIIEHLIFNMNIYDCITVSVDILKEIHKESLTCLRVDYEGVNQVLFYRMYKNKSERRYVYVIVYARFKSPMCTIQCVGHSDIENKKPLFDIKEAKSYYVDWVSRYMNKWINEEYYKKGANYPIDFNDWPV